MEEFLIGTTSWISQTKHQVQYFNTYTLHRTISAGEIWFNMKSQLPLLSPTARIAELPFLTSKEIDQIHFYNPGHFICSHLNVPTELWTKITSCTSLPMFQDVLLKDPTFIRMIFIYGLTSLALEKPCDDE